MKRPRDVQREKSYRWENKYWSFNDSSMPLNECSDLVHKARRMFGLGSIKIADGRGCRWARGGKRVVTLPCWSRNRTVVLHEAAHSITETLFGDRVAAHGKEWLGVYMYLLERYGGQDLKEMVARANDANLLFISKNAVLAMIRERKRAA